MCIGQKGGEKKRKREKEGEKKRERKRDNIRKGKKGYDQGKRDGYYNLFTKSKVTY